LSSDDRADEGSYDVDEAAPERDRCVDRLLVNVDERPLLRVST
jgi:hypothetical protein